MYSMECICTHLLTPHVMAYCCYDDDMIFSIFLFMHIYLIFSVIQYLTKEPIFVDAGCGAREI